MRMIDADKMLERLEVWNTSDNTDKALYNFAWNRIAEQPTAYDVNKVIEQLENEASRCASFFCDDYRDDYERGKFEAYNEAVEIVKRGGVGE